MYFIFNITLYGSINVILISYEVIEINVNVIFLLQVQKREIFSMTPGKHIVPNEVELKCFLFSG